VNRRFILATALLVPALAFVSCKDDGNSNPVEPQVNTPQVPSSNVIRRPSVTKLRFPQASAQAKAEAAKIEAQNLTTTTTGAPHDPALALGMAVACFGGADVDDGDPTTTYGGTSQRFANGRGCEHNTIEQGPNGSVAVTVPTIQLLPGKRLTHVTRLEFTFAGGPPQGGSPRMDLYVDTCQRTYQPTAAHDCPAGTATDGIWDETVFIAADRCNDGDANVGSALIKSVPATKTDQTCFIDVNGGAGVPGGETFNNWAEYVASRGPGARFAVTFGPAFGNAPAENDIISDQAQHYLIYRLFMRARIG